MKKELWMFLVTPDGEGYVMGKADAENIKASFENAASWIEADMQSDCDLSPEDYRFEYQMLTQDEVDKLPEP